MDPQTAQALLPGFLTFTRLLAFFGTAPLFSLGSIPVAARVGIALLVSVALAPAAPAAASDTGLWPLLVLQEVVVGALVGYAAALVVHAAQAAGSVLSMQVGFNFNQLVNPGALITGGQAETLMNTLAGLVFLYSGAHVLFLDALVESLRVLPVGGAVVVPEAALSLITWSVVLGIRLALPVLAVLLVAEVGMMILSRLLQQMNVFMVAFPAKVGLFFIGTALTIPFLAALVLASFGQAAEAVRNIVRIMAGS